MLEQRFLPEVRAVSDAGKPLQIVGYAATFNTFAKLPQFRERILPGAFTRALNQKDDVVCLWNHMPEKLLGRTTSGTLRLGQDSRGLQYVCDLPNTSEARGFHESIKRGDVTGSSFQFTLAPDDQDWDEAQDEEDRSYFVRRTIKSITSLRDVSPVIFPAYGNTDVSARSIAVASVPTELRSRVDSLNARRTHKRSRSRVYVPSMKELLEATMKMDPVKRALADEEIVTRRKSLLDQMLS